MATAVLSVSFGALSEEAGLKSGGHRFVVVVVVVVVLLLVAAFSRLSPVFPSAESFKTEESSRHPTLTEGRYM